STSGENYWAQQAAIQRLGALAWLELAEKHEPDALARMREAATMEDGTEKSPVTPGPLAPARELLGDMLMELGRPGEAFTEYRTALTREPNRFRLLSGAMRAALASGNRPTAAQYRGELQKSCRARHVFAVRRAECLRARALLDPDSVRIPGGGHGDADDRAEPGAERDRDAGRHQDAGAIRGMSHPAIRAGGDHALLGAHAHF